MAFSLYSFIFLIAVTVVFYGIRKVARPYVLLLAGYIYIGFLDINSLFSILLCTVVVYAAGLLIQEFKGRGKDKFAIIATFLSIIILGVILILTKYSSRFEILNTLILPIGFSYYAFQAIAYLADILLQKYKAEKNIGIFALYMSFFPKFVSGPIERCSTFMPQLKKLENVKFRDEYRLSLAFAYILYGYFMKVAVADNLGTFVSILFEGYENHSSLWLFVGSLSYTMQIYCDFAGYSALAVGIAKIFGIDVIENFMSPYLSANISEFWRRWHRSLSFWLRDYVYITLGGNRKGIARQCLNTMVVFILCGIWHGNGFNFLFWGLLHGVYSIIGILIKKYGAHKNFPILGRTATFLSVSFAWIFFGASSFSGAVKYIKCMFTAGNAGYTFLSEAQQMGIIPEKLLLLSLFIILVIAMDIVSYRKDKVFPELIQDFSCGSRYFLYYLAVVLILVFGAYGPGFDAGQFMYMNF